MAETGKRLAADITTIRYNDEVLLGKYLSNNISDTFTVLATPIRLVAFGMTDDKARVMRVWRSPSSGARDACGDLLPSGEVFEMPYKVGCVEVVLNKYFPEVVIDGRGEYRVVYEGDNRPDIHVVQFVDGAATVNDTVRGLNCACCEE